MTNYDTINSEVLLIQSELATIRVVSGIDNSCGNSTETEQLITDLQLRITNLLAFLDSIINPK
jgi:hypothetical protein